MNRRRFGADFLEIGVYSGVETPPDIKRAADIASIQVQAGSVLQS
jgi:hypothetical protein